MPRETGCRSFFRLCVYLSNPPGNRHQAPRVRRSGVLACHQTVVEGTLQVVANWYGTGTDAARASGAVTAGRRQPGDGSSAGLAAAERLKKIFPIPLAFRFLLWHTDGRRSFTTVETLFL